MKLSRIISKFGTDRSELLAVIGIEMDYKQLGIRSTDNNAGCEQKYSKRIRVTASNPYTYGRGPYPLWSCSISCPSILVAATWSDAPSPRFLRCCANKRTQLWLNTTGVEGTRRI